ncbi:MAG TPA: IclR family transcriptional regulator C-terminal domain-containing protein [Actinophytocola sp.]|nr:IclR family transcriptional regulator C-terminal domain-containing protein [Actinophytocola sp.]
MRRRDPALLTRRHRTVGRIAAILEAAAADDGVRLSTLATMLDAPKSSIHGLLKGLVSVGYLAESGDGYSLGPAIQVLLGSGERPLLEEVAAGAMRGLRDQFDETVLLGHRMGDSIVYLSAVESHHPVKYVARLNTRRPVLPTSMGKIYLAELGQDDLAAYLTERIQNTRRRKALTAQLAEVATTGVAVNRDESVPGLTGVAAGIRERDELVACVSVAGPSDRLIPRLEQLTRAVKATADRVTAQLP